MKARREAYIVMIKLGMHYTWRDQPKTFVRSRNGPTYRHVHGISSPTRWAPGAYITFSRTRRWAAHTRREWMRGS